MTKMFPSSVYALALVALGACAADDPTVDEGPLEQTSEALQKTPGNNPCGLVRCRAGFTCKVDDGRAVCVPAPVRECRFDKDCRLESNYCEGCTCEALGIGERLPKCQGNQVACLIDPCRDFAAFCEEGQCVAERGAIF